MDMRTAVSKYALPIIIGLIVAFVVAAAFGFLISAAGGTAGVMPAIIGGFFGVFTAYIMANLAGNRTGKAASDEQKTAAVNLTPPAGQALLIVYRDGLVGMAAGLNINLDGKVVAQLKSPRFTAIPLTVGSHEMALAFGGLAGAQNNAALERFGVGEGEVVAYRATVAMGALKNSVTLERINADAALTAKLKPMTMTAPEA